MPCVTGRPATAQDVKKGRAVFVLSAQGTHALRIDLPRYAIWHDGEKRKDVPVICIQAEGNAKTKLVGLRLLGGGAAVCTLSELTL